LRGSVEDLSFQGTILPGALDRPFFYHLFDIHHLRGSGAPAGIWYRGGSVADLYLSDDDDCLGVDDRRGHVLGYVTFTE